MKYEIIVRAFDEVEEIHRLSLIADDNPESVADKLIVIAQALGALDDNFSVFLIVMHMLTQVQSSQVQALGYSMKAHVDGLATSCDFDDVVRVVVKASAFTECPRGCVALGELPEEYVPYENQRKE